MSRLRAMDADVEHALEQINVPAYVIDTHGIIRWVNPAGRRLVGDVTGRQFTSVVAPEETRRARDVLRPEDRRQRRVDRRGGGARPGRRRPGQRRGQRRSALLGRADHRRLRPARPRRRGAGPSAAPEPDAAAGRGATPARARPFDVSRSQASSTSARRRCATTSATCSARSASTPGSRPSPSPGTATWRR